MSGPHFHGFHGGFHGGQRIDPMIIPLILIAIIGFRRRAAVNWIADHLPWDISDRTLAWAGWIGILSLYGTTCFLYATYATGAWCWSPGLVFAAVEVLRMLVDDTSKMVLGEPYDR